jgi:hypothetical protein
MIKGPAPAGPVCFEPAFARDLPPAQHRRGPQGRRGDPGREDKAVLPERTGERAGLSREAWPDGRPKPDRTILWAEAAVGHDPGGSVEVRSVPAGNATYMMHGTSSLLAPKLHSYDYLQIVAGGYPYRPGDGPLDGPGQGLVDGPTHGLRRRLTDRDVRGPAGRLPDALLVRDVGADAGRLPHTPGRALLRALVRPLLRPLLRPDQGPAPDAVPAHAVAELPVRATTATGSTGRWSAPGDSP